MTEKAGLVLIVDDDAGNVVLMEKMLANEGYETLSAKNGREGIEKARSGSPDVILLDIMMPEMDGFEVCRHLVSHPDTAHIPVLMITALDHREDMIRGMKAGASDFLAKPVDRERVSLRIGNAVRLKRMHDRVAGTLERLKELERMKDSLVHMIVHDLKSPLTGISGYIELVKSKLESSGMTEEHGYARKAFREVQHLNEMINSLLEVNRLEEGKMQVEWEEFPVEDLLKDALAVLGELPRDVQVIREARGVETIKADYRLLRRVMTNLLSNAVKYSPQGGQVMILVIRDSRGIRFSVLDEGPGIPEKYHGRIFEKFSQLEMRDEGELRSTGLGLTFCKLAVEAHKGTIKVSNRPTGGSLFQFHLPQNP